MSVITIRKIFELAVSAPAMWWVCSVASRTFRGTGAIELRRLVKEALRSAPGPSSLVRCARPESLDMLIALNAGLPGMCTIHANSARDAVTKILYPPLLAGENISPRRSWCRP